MKLRTRLLLSFAVACVPLTLASFWAQRVLDQRAEVDALARFLEARMVDGRAECEADPQRFPLPPRGGRGRRGEGGRELDREGPRDGPRDGPRGGRDRGPDGPRDGARGGGGRGGGGRGEPPLWQRGERGSERLASPDPRVVFFAFGPDFVSENPFATPIPDGLRAELERGARIASSAERTGDRTVTQVAMRMAWDTGPCALMFATHARPTPKWVTRNQLLTTLLLVGALAAAVSFAAGPAVSGLRRLAADVRRSAGQQYREPIPVRGSGEVGELASAFNEASEEVRLHVTSLEEREATLRQFVGNVTHDVMIPLTVLKGHLAELRESGANGDAVRGAMEEAQYLSGLLHNLGIAAELEAGRPELERSSVSLDELVERVFARHVPIARSKGVQLDRAVPEQPLTIPADLTLLEQAVSNLVHNAVRYTPKGGHVALVLEESAAGWRVRVIDDGPGIPEAQREQLLERSARTDEARTRHPDGRGLGLHICAEVARRHGFRLELCESEYGGLEAILAGSVGPLG